MTDIADLLNKTLRFLSYRSRSRFEIVNYLKKRDVDQTNIDILLNKLEELTLIDDTDFAQQWTQAQLSKGKGPKFIRLQLINKGVSVDTINHVINDLSPEELYSSARSIAKKKVKTKLSDFQAKMKLKQYLYGRGFSSNTINAVVDDLMQERVE